MQLQKVTRKQQKMRLALQGDTHTGKTLSALLLAYGITGDWSKIAIVDTEEQSASYYCHLGNFNTLQLSAPFKTEKFCEAIELCENSLMEVVILDSISPEWVGEGGILYQYAATKGNKAEKYDAVMPNHHTFLSYILNCPIHVFATVRSTGNKVEQQKGIVHHFTTVLNLDHNHEAMVLKDRTGLFDAAYPTVLSEATGAKIKAWCELGEEFLPVELQCKINACKSQQELLKLLMDSDVENVRMVSAFTKKRLELEGIIDQVPKSQNADKA
ncbi:MAG: AAA family ATPase, partial [Flavisolibacter sp.]